MKEVIRSIAGALCLAVMFVSSIFLIAAISYKSEPVAVIYALFISVVYFLTLISPDKKKWLIKYLLSIPLSFGIITYFWKTDYSVRALNWAYPEYGRFSAGGNLNGLMQVVLFSGISLVAIIVSLFIKPKKGNAFNKLQNIVCLAATAAVVIFTLLLEAQFPEKILAG